ncbi:MAG: MAPEG family protein [Alphaproteobacteria bacterium]|nr:MAPEG family protein [Alphaproteobacteria bacterium]NDC57112.1 MAPEG family protein [Alphaproteobacteria bacterium]
MEQTLATFPYAYTGLVTLAAVLMKFVFAWNVGQARRKHGVAPPLTHGPDEFNRVLRVQSNTTEQMIIFLPVLWLVAVVNSDTVAASLGLVWVLARIWYAFGYLAGDGKRMPGFLINIVVSSILFVYAAWGLLAQVMG